MRMTDGRTWRWWVLGALALAAVEAGYWLFSMRPEAMESETPPARNSRFVSAAGRIRCLFSAAGVKRIVLRAGMADTAEVITGPAAEVVEVSAVPAGGAQGYHSPDPNWRETPAAEWGLDFVSARQGDLLIISSKNEIQFIHHEYYLHSVALRVPAGVEVVREHRELTGNGEPDLSQPKR